MQKQLVHIDQAAATTCNDPLDQVCKFGMVLLFDEGNASHGIELVCWFRRLRGVMRTF